MLLQTFRRTELVIFILTQRDNLGLKTEITRSNVLELTTSDGKKKKTLNFDKIGLEDEKGSKFKEVLGLDSY